MIKSFGSDFGFPKSAARIEVFDITGREFEKEERK